MHAHPAIARCIDGLYTALITRFYFTRICVLPLCLLIFTCCRCSGSEKGTPTSAAGTKCTLAEGTDELNPQTYHKYFEKHQAAYYVAEGDNLLLAIRIKEDMETAEVMGKFLVLVTSRFDFYCDKRKQIILVCYKGLIEEKRNIGMLIEVSDLKMLQKGIIDIDELSERAKYIEGLDMGSVKSLIYK